MITEHTRLIAAVAHAAVRELHLRQEDQDYPVWDDLSRIEQDNELMWTDYIMDHPFLGAAAAHADWVARMMREPENWKFGPTFDAATKTDPRLKAFGALSQREQLDGLLRKSVIAVLARP